MDQSQKKMLSAICRNYGGPSAIEIVSIGLPEISGNEVLVENHASALTTADTMLRSGTPKFARPFIGLTKPKNPYLGTGFSGTVVKVGDQVKSLKPGDEVFGESGLNFSANSEFVKVEESGVIHKKPDFITHEVACIICDGFLTSYNFLNSVYELRSGQRILINGAAGALGSAAVQLAKIKGAYVIATASLGNFDYLKDLGADVTIDYQDSDALSKLFNLDCIYDCVGKMDYPRAKNMLSKTGTYISPVLKLSLLRHVLFTSIFSNGKKARFDATGLKDANQLKKYIADILELIKSNKLTPRIDKEFSLQQISEAHRLIDNGHKKSNFIISFKKENINES
jgi:NADPH:quinone reductase-like Zn-dependent oxidoreductase